MNEAWQKGRWLLVAASSFIGAGVLLTFLQGEPLPPHALARAPADAQVVAWIAVPAVMRSHAWSALLEEDRGDDVRRVEEACGFDPLAQLREAVVFAAGSDERAFERVGVVASGPLADGRERRETLVRCVRTVLSERRLGVRETDVDGTPAIASQHGSSMAAFVGDDGIVGGDAPVVIETLRVLRGNGASAAADPGLMELWQDVARDRDVIMVVRPPASWGAGLRRAARLIGEDLGALLTVRMLGLGARVRDGFGLRLVAQTQSGQDASELRDAARLRLAAALEDRRLRLSAAGPVLRGVQVDARGGRLTASLSMTNAQLDALLELWRELRASAPSESAPSESAPSESAPSESAPSESAQPELEGEGGDASSEGNGRSPTDEAGTSAERSETGTSAPTADPGTSAEP